MDNMCSNYVEEISDDPSNKKSLALRLIEHFTEASIGACEAYVFMDISCSVGKEEFDKSLTDISKLAEHTPVYLQFFNAQLVGEPTLVRGAIRCNEDVRGGTCFQGPIDLAIENKAKQIVIFSDGYAPEPDYKNYCGKILWVISKDGFVDVKNWRGDKIYLT